MTAHTSASARPLSGTIRVPGDKSMSHRAVMFAGLAEGTTRLDGLLEGEDVMATAAAMRAMGATVTRTGEGTWEITGVGARGLASPTAPIDCGNSGTSARLLAGLVAPYNIEVTFTGDASLTRRPMKRIMDPLGQMGVRFAASEGGRLPLTLTGGNLVPIDYDMPMASAQVKSAILLAGLGTQGTTRVREPLPSRDHTERMLEMFGVRCGREGATITITGPARLTAPSGVIPIPSDPSSAAFFIVAALLVPGSDLTIEGVGINPTRTGLLDTLREMGGQIDVLNMRHVGGEPVADLRVRASRLRGVRVPESRVPSMVDEFPVLFVAASFAEGQTEASGLEELRVKESDRLALMARSLAACGVTCEEGPASLLITGNGQPPVGGATIETHLDHRIAMSFLVMGMASASPVTIDDGAAIATSFPGFIGLARSVGAAIS